MNILITGANGFIGKALTKQMLKCGNYVFAIVTNKKDMEDLICDKLIVIELFFEQYNQISSLIDKHIDLAYHLAWEGLSGQKAADVSTQLKNVQATYVLLNELLALKTKKIVFCSTMNVLEVRDYLGNPTNYKPRKTYIHVASKINAEIISRVFCEENGIQYNESILAMAYGPNNNSKMITNVFLYNLINNNEPALISGKEQYDLIYVDDIINAMQLIGEKGHDGKSYYVGHNWNRTFKDIFEEIRNIVNPKVNITFGAFKDENHINFNLINREELSEDTGWEIQTPFEESIIKTVDWIKKSNFKI